MLILKLPTCRYMDQSECLSVWDSGSLGFDVTGAHTQNLGFVCCLGDFFADRTMGFNMKNHCLEEYLGCHPHAT